MLKLNLGAGGNPLPGFQNLDRKTGQEIYPLGYADGSVDEIRASHVLEHFGHGEVAAVLAEWVRVLKPGGILRIAVPDFDKIVEWYKEERSDLPLMGYLFGGQTDADDFHKSAFNEDGLRADLEAAGLIDVQMWESEIEDCARLPVSLNLQGTKPPLIRFRCARCQNEPKILTQFCGECGARLSLESIFPKANKAAPVDDVGTDDSPVRVHAVASVPRLGFNATWHCTITALNALGIELTMVEGAFWGQCLTRGIQTAISTGADYIITIDYDSVFTPAHLHRLCQLIIEHPEYDAIVPVQIKRENDTALFKLNGDRDFNKALTRIASGHFGLTIFKASAFSTLPKPWFHGQPNEAGEWGEKRIDDDIWFWRQWGLSGKKVALANDVRIGHIEMMVTWPGEGFRPVRQSITNYRNEGQPSECGGGLRVNLIS